uniref:CCT domain-containing protein n=1 Tax=Globisporangium ultimum (strain ATCC 200006 / CBS 805.95 / DAOM BR144) TaxID=431595 RepID=K3X626_GLOUD
MGSRVFVRLYDGARQAESDDVVLTLPPPPLKWAGVLSVMVAAIDKADDEDDDPDDALARAAAAIPPARIAKARLFLLPSEAQGIVAELNARGLRGIRENDQFVVCLDGEDYQKRMEKQQEQAAGVKEAGSGASVPTPPSSHTSTSSTSSPSAMKSPTTEEQQVLLYTSTNSYRKNLYPSLSSSSTTASVAPTSSVAAPGGTLGLGMKGSKRYRSISGKMAAIKSLGDKGLISADDRGHLKDLLLNNDSPQLQEALDQYNSTGDFQAVKAILMKELSAPSTKRNTGDWISDTLINDINMNFNTNDSSAMASQASSGAQYPPASQAAYPAANPFMYQQSNSTSNGEYHQSDSAAASSSMGYAASPATAGHDHLSGGAPVYHQHDQTNIMGLDAASYTQQPQQLPMPTTGLNQYGGAAQINLPVRDPSSTNLRTYGAASLPTMDLRYGAVPYATTPMSGDLQTVPAMYSSSMGYASDVVPQDYNRMGMSPYGMVATPNAGGYHPTMYQQQPQQYGNMSRYAYGNGGMVNGIGGVGYEYQHYGVAGYGGFDKTHLRNSGKWTTAPPMPSYPPACSKEEKKEKIAKWLKKRESRNWSNKPSYPVRHSIAKARKRGEDGRFITKARLAEMALEEAANGGNGGADGQPHIDGGASEYEISSGYDHVSMTMLPPPTSVP